MSENIERGPDEGHLRLLSVSYYVIASMSALGGCIVMSFALIGVAVMAGVVEELPREMAMFLGMVLTIIESILALFIWTMALLEFWTGRSLATHTRYSLCFVIACIEMLNIPCGTVVGIFTIVVLLRPSVKALFEGRDHRDPRLAFADSFDDDDDDTNGGAAAPKTPRTPGSESIQEGSPNP